MGGGLNILDEQGYLIQSSGVPGGSETNTPRPRNVFQYEAGRIRVLPRQTSQHEQIDASREDSNRTPEQPSFLRAYDARAPGLDPPRRSFQVARRR